jgi:hypothetical protein
MGCMPLDYLSNTKSQVEMQKANVILKVEYDLQQCVHVPQKRSQNHSHNHMGQNSFIKDHTLYPKGHQKKDMVNEPRKKPMPPNLK